MVVQVFVQLLLMVQMTKWCSLLASRDFLNVKFEEISRRLQLCTHTDLFLLSPTLNCLLAPFTTRMNIVHAIIYNLVSMPFNRFIDYFINKSLVQNSYWFRSSSCEVPNECNEFTGHVVLNSGHVSWYLPVLTHPFYGYHQFKIS